MKKILALLILLTLVVSVFAACKKEDKPADETPDTPAVEQGPTLEDAKVVLRDLYKNKSENTASDLDVVTGVVVGETCIIGNNVKLYQGVTGFVGANSNERPRPISADEAKALLQKAGEIKGEKPTRMKQSFSVGEQVKIIEGAFASFTGTIEEVNLEKNKLRVMVAIFGRATPVELDLLQVEKI